MRVIRLTPLLLTLLYGAGCDILASLQNPEPTCDPHTAYYRDADGDGLADPASSVYFGCELPEGYVTTPPGEVVDDSDADDSDADTDVHSDPDTDPVDTDPVDTDPVDTDPVDTDVAP